MSKINKALDLNKLFGEQAQGRLLKKNVLFSMFSSIKFDGNYVCIQVSALGVTFNTSGGLQYTHLDNAGDIFNGVAQGAYFAERIWGKGLLGDRDRCNLKGPKSAQTSEGHSYRVFDYICIEDYLRGETDVAFMQRLEQLHTSGLPKENIARQTLLRSQAQLDELLAIEVKAGYEGLMAISPAHLWKDTKSRKVDLIKYKKRPTADLLCIGITEGEGKYEGFIGALVLQDSTGRTVSVGSGLSDSDRNCGSSLISSVFEIEYERIADTYIQPTVVRIREDKGEEDID